MTQSIAAVSRRRFGTGLAAALGLAGALAGCGGTVAGPAPGPQAAPPGLGGGASSSVVAVGPPPPIGGGPGQAQSGPPVVALLLPLSGPNATLGRALQDAAQMAVFDNADRSFRLIPRDTGGTPDGAARAAQEAIAQGARLIVGPLLATEAQAVGPIAAGAGINVITLSNDRSVAAGNVFVIGLTPNQQMTRLVGFARSRGAARFAALLPSNAYGNAVEESVRATGAELVRVERYDAAGDPSAAVQALTGQAAGAGAAQPGRPGAAPQRAQVDFDALVMPDQVGRLLTIAPLVQFYGIDTGQVRILGSAFMGWDPRIQREPSLAGAWYAGPPPESRADFDRRYRETYSRDAPPLATLAYDATAVAAVLAKTRNGDFSAEALAAPQGYAGMDGLFRFRPDGTAERALAVIEVQRDGLRVVSPAARSFDAVGQ